MKANIVRHARKLPPGVESAAAEIEPTPCFGKAFETVKAVNDALSDARSDETDGASRVHAEFEVMAVDLRLRERVLDQLTLAVKAKSIGQGALDVVDRSLERAQRALAHRMDPAHIEELVKSADELVEDVFEFEIGDEHIATRHSLADRAKHVDRAERVQKRAPFDIRFQRREQPVNQAWRKIGKKVETLFNHDTPARIRKYIDHFLRAKAVFAGATVAGRQFEQFAHDIVAVRLEHNDLVGYSCQRTKNIRRCRLDVVQDSDEEC